MRPRLLQQPGSRLAPGPGRGDAGALWEHACLVVAFAEVFRAQIGVVADVVCGTDDYVRGSAYRFETLTAALDAAVVVDERAVGQSRAGSPVPRKCSTKKARQKPGFF